MRAGAGVARVLVDGLLERAGGWLLRNSALRSEFSLEPSIADENTVCFEAPFIVQLIFAKRQKGLYVLKTFKLPGITSL